MQQCSELLLSSILSDIILIISSAIATLFYYGIIMSTMDVVGPARGLPVRGAGYEPADIERDIQQSQMSSKHQYYTTRDAVFLFNRHDNNNGNNNNNTDNNYILIDPP